MGSEISSFVVEPILGASAMALAIMAIIKNKSNETTKAKWYAIGSIMVLFLLIVANILMAVML